MDLMCKDCCRSKSSQQRGFTLLEAAIALVILMVIGLGIASLFTYAIRANSRADDRELAMAIAQKRLEWLRTIPFTTQTRDLPYSYPDGGLGVVGITGVTEPVVSAGRSFSVRTVIRDINFVPAGNPDAGEPTLKRIQISVFPAGATTFETVTVTTMRSTQVTGVY